MGRFSSCADCVTPLPHLISIPLFQILFTDSSGNLTQSLSLFCKNGVSATSEKHTAVPQLCMFGQFVCWYEPQGPTAVCSHGSLKHVLEAHNRVVFLSFNIISMKRLSKYYNYHKIGAVYF